MKALVETSTAGAEMCVRLGLHAALARNAALSAPSGSKGIASDVPLPKAGHDAAPAVHAREALAALIQELGKSDGKSMNLKAVAHACKVASTAASPKGKGARFLQKMEGKARRGARGLLGIF